MSDTVMIVSGESSGELYGALLADELRKAIPNLRLIGIGGERMRGAGVELVSGIASAFGLVELVRSVRSLRQNFRAAVQALEEYTPRVLVLIDYPDFNLKLAGEARRRNIQILYYVSPQVWAWRPNRVKKIARLVHRMAVLLPFEEEIYRKAGLHCEFVGHPIMDEIRQLSPDKKKIRHDLGLQDNSPILSLLPGSRHHELDRLLPVILDVVRTMKKEFPSSQFCVPFAPNTDLSKYHQIIACLRDEGVIVNKGEALKTLYVSDCAVVASGTASLQSVLLGTPTIVIYKMAPLSFFLGRLIVKVSHISLANILSGGEVIRELLQENAAPVHIIAELRRIIEDGSYRADMLEKLTKLRALFNDRHASRHVAAIVADMGGWGR